MLGLKDTADNPSSCKSVGHVGEVKQPLRSQANGTSEGALFQPKKHKHARRTIRPGKPAGLCTRCKMSSCLETLLHGEGGLSTHKVFQITQLHCMILNDLMNNGTGREGWCIGWPFLLYRKMTTATELDQSSPSFNFFPSHSAVWLDVSRTLHKHSSRLSLDT